MRRHQRLVPPEVPPPQTNRRRRRTIVGSRPGLPTPLTPPSSQTATEGAESCTLNPDYPTKTALTTTQPPPKVHHHAPSTRIGRGERRIRRRNRHRGSNIVHPRPRLGRERGGFDGVIGAEGTQPCTLDAGERSNQKQWDGFRTEIGVFATKSGSKCPQAIPVLLGKSRTLGPAHIGPGAQ